MAKWVIVRGWRGKEGTRLVYENLVTKQQFDLGGVDSSLPDYMLVDWVANHAKDFTPGDMVILSDGTPLHYSTHRGAA